MSVHLEYFSLLSCSMLYFLRTKFDVYRSQFTQFIAKIYLFHLRLLLSKQCSRVQTGCYSTAFSILTEIYVLMLSFCSFVALTLHFFLRTAYPSWWQILWPTFIRVSLFFHIWISCFDFTICTFPVVKRENMAGRYNQNLIFPKATLTVHPNFVVRSDTDARTHITRADQNEKKWHSPNANRMKIMQTKFTWITIKCEKCEKHIFT